MNQVQISALANWMLTLTESGPGEKLKVLTHTRVVCRSMLVYI